MHPCQMDLKYLTKTPMVHLAVLRKMTCEQVRKAIQKLEPQQQWLIKEVFFNGRKQADIARELGVGKTRC